MRMVTLPCSLSPPACLPHPLQESAGTYAYLRDVACLKVRRAGSWSSGLAGGQGSGARPASACALLLLGYVCRHRCRPAGSGVSSPTYLLISS